MCSPPTATNNAQGRKSQDYSPSKPEKDISTDEKYKQHIAKVVSDIAHNTIEALQNDMDKKKLEESLYTIFATALQGYKAYA